MESADIIILGTRLEAIAAAHEISRRGYRKMLQNVSLACCFSGIGIPVAATGLIYPVWAMAASVTTIFFNSLWGKSALFFDAIMSVGRPLQVKTGNFSKRSPLQPQPLDADAQKAVFVLLGVDATDEESLLN
jgi:Cu+-exporting ATPase